MQELGEDTIAEVLGSLQYATEAAPGWAKAWHNWALFNVQVKHCPPPAHPSFRGLGCLRSIEGLPSVMPHGMIEKMPHGVDFLFLFPPAVTTSRPAYPTQLCIARRLVIVRVEAQQDQVMSMIETFKFSLPPKQQLPFRIATLL